MLRMPPSRRGTFLPILICLWLGTPKEVCARTEWYRGLDLEGALAQASLVLVARVDGVREIRVIGGGKSEQVIEQFEFRPLGVLKGVFSRDVLSLSSEDLGVKRIRNKRSRFAWRL